MADKNIRFKDKSGNALFPQTKLGNILDADGNKVDFGQFITSEEFAQAIAGIETLKIKVVSALPIISEAESNVVYLVPATDSENGNLFLEYMLINGAWELIGTAGIDLSGYVTKTDLEQDYYDKESVDKKLSQVSGDITYDEVQ